MAATAVEAGVVAATAADQRCTSAAEVVMAADQRCAAEDMVEGLRSTSAEVTAADQRSVLAEYTSVDIVEVLTLGWRAEAAREDMLDRH